MANNNRRNRLEVPGAESVMEKLKLEVANELGIPNYDQLDKGDLPARVHGKIGGTMVRKMIEYAEQAMKADAQALTSVEGQRGANEEDIATVQAYVSQDPTSAGQEIQQGNLH
jgi:hypothetical protein